MFCIFHGCAIFNVLICGYFIWHVEVPMLIAMWLVERNCFYLIYYFLILVQIVGTSHADILEQIVETEQIPFDLRAFYVFMSVIDILIDVTFWLLL